MWKWRVGSCPLGQWYWTCGPWISAPPEKLLELQSCRSHPRPAESDSLMEGPSKLQFNKLCPLKCKNHFSTAVFLEVWYLFLQEHNTFAT